MTKKATFCPCSMQSRQMSSSQIATALRPFYFFVHPDLFGKYPSERAVNESSLQSLSSFIETVKSEKPHSATTLTFYLKPQPSERCLKSVRIRLNENDVQKTVSSILSSCNLPTTYVDNLTRNEKYPGPGFKRKMNYSFEDNDEDIMNSMAYAIRQTLDNQLLHDWLKKNISKSQERLKKCEPVKEEITRLRSEISAGLGIAKLILDCGWNIRHYRGCLASFQNLAHHHPKEMKVLKGRTLVFGSHTGISFDGHVLLNSGEVRHNWLDFIKNIPKEDAVLLTLPSFERSVSRVLRDIKLVRRKFQPKTMAKQYENNLRRLTTTLSDHQGRYGFPKDWPESLSNYELVVETEAGPLMVSPTGQFIVPSSCPSTLLVNFITDNLDEAKRLNKHYQSHKHIEKDLEKKCVDEFELSDISKDDNISPDLMINCCSRLLRNKESLKYLLEGSHLYVANYYSIMSDGQICIPWNWKL